MILRFINKLIEALTALLLWVIDMIMAGLYWLYKVVKKIFSWIMSRF